jgi:hypothetical protein
MTGGRAFQGKIREVLGHRRFIGKINLVYK